MTSLIERSARLAAIGVRALVDQAGLADELKRPVALYLLVNQCNLPGATVARVAGCSKQNVSKTIRRVEDLRDRAPIDAAIAALEARLEGGF
jgi:hexokinase